MEINLCLYLFYVCFLILFLFFLISLIDIYNTSTLFSGEERNIIKSFRAKQNNSAYEETPHPRTDRKCSLQKPQEKKKKIQSFPITPILFNGI